MEEHRTPLRLTPNYPKIVYSIAFLLEKAKSMNRKLTRYDIVKSLFIADRHHLNQWGRPVTYDNYKAMEHGPVADSAYNLLRGDPAELAKSGFPEMPWVSSPAGGNKHEFTLAGAPLDFDDYLSQSDQEALEEALSAVNVLSFTALRWVTHQDEAYKAAWAAKRDSAKSHPMDFALLFDEPDFERAQEICEASQHV